MVDETFAVAAQAAGVKVFVVGVAAKILAVRKAEIDVSVALRGKARLIRFADPGD